MAMSDAEFAKHVNEAQGVATWRKCWRTTVPTTSLALEVDGGVVTIRGVSDQRLTVATGIAHLLARALLDIPESEG